MSVGRELSSALDPIEVFQVLGGERVSQSRPALWAYARQLLSLLIPHRARLEGSYLDLRDRAVVVYPFTRIRLL
jgi:hypothetical protein